MITSVRQASGDMENDIHSESAIVERVNGRHINDAREAFRQRIEDMWTHDTTYYYIREFGIKRMRDKFSATLDLQGSRRKTKLPPGLPGHLVPLCETPILTADEEVHLFRGLNLEKYLASRARERIKSDYPNSENLQHADEFDLHLQNATNLRTRIALSNFRLVISVVKKFVDKQYTFDEALSEGNMSLLRAIDGFDFDRGFRFSTYATQVVRRNVIHDRMQRTKYRMRFRNEEELLAQGECEPELVDKVRLHDAQKLRVAELAARAPLDRRERLILRWRFGLKRPTGEYPRETKTFQYLADKLGVSKERVRQLEQRALEKLKITAADYGVIDPADD